MTENDTSAYSVVIPVESRNIAVLIYFDKKSKCKLK
jgi:hypothetical protein